MKIPTFISAAALWFVVSLSAAEGLIGHWKLAGDAKDSSGAGRHAVNHEVKFSGGSGAFNGRDAWLEVPAKSLPALGRGDFSIAAWVHTERVVDDALRCVAVYMVECFVYMVLTM